MGSALDASRSSFAPDSQANSPAAAVEKEERARLTERVRKRERSTAQWTKFWSFVHHTALFGGVVLSGIATILLAAKWPTSTPDFQAIATICAGTATLIGTLAISGGFAAKWRANSNELTGLRLLGIDADSPSVSNDELRKRLKMLIADSDSAIVNASTVRAAGVSHGAPGER